MLILALDTSTRTGSLAFLQDNRVLDQVSAQEETPYSTRLFRDLELLQSRAQFRMEQIDVFAVASGPVSFQPDRAPSHAMDTSLHQEQSYRRLTRIDSRAGSATLLATAGYSLMLVRSDPIW